MVASSIFSNVTTLLHHTQDILRRREIFVLPGTTISTSPQWFGKSEFYAFRVGRFLLPSCGEHSADSVLPTIWDAEGIIFGCGIVFSIDCLVGGCQRFDLRIFFRLNPIGTYLYAAFLQFNGDDLNFNVLRSAYVKGC